MFIILHCIAKIQADKTGLLHWNRCWAISFKPDTTNKFNAL